MIIAPSRMANDRLVMFEDQWLVLAKELGVVQETFAREVHQLISDRSPGSDNNRFISFDQFPEAIARLAAVRYDYIVPDTVEEALKEAEVPEVLAEALNKLPSRPRSASGSRPQSARARGGGGDDLQVHQRYQPARLLKMMVDIFLNNDILHNARISKVPGNVTREKSQGRLQGRPGWS